MTSTQPNIHNFFKGSRRSTRNINKKAIKSEPPVSLKNDLINNTNEFGAKDVTPKRKREDEEMSNKRRRKEEEPTVYKTPTKATIKEESGKSSACKKLNLANDGEGANKTKKKPTPEELKAMLGKCNRLDVLRSRLVKATKCNEKLKSFQNEVNSEISLSSSPLKSPLKTTGSPQLKSFSSLDVMVPVSPITSPLKSPLKTPVKTPAYLKYSHLTTTPSNELQLPYHYGILKKIFVAMDRISSMLYNRPEIITFSKLKTNVQEAVKKAFTMNHLGQVKFVFPNAYKYLWEKIKGSGLVESKSGSYELVLEPILDQKASKVAKDLTSMFDNKSLTTTKTTYKKMNNIILAERENMFHNLLIAILKQHHQEYLKTLGIDMESKEKEVQRWHPMFLQADIPEVEAAELPKPPAVEKIDTAQDMLAKARDVFSVNSRLLSAVENSASKEKEQQEKCVPKTPTPPQPNNNVALKGISLSLLAKVRAREAEKAAKQMTRSKAEVDELERLSRLPEVARIIRSMFISEKKAALTWEFVTAKLVSSHSSLISTCEVDIHLNLLLKEIPNWCTVHKIRSGTYLKIDKNRQLNDITDKLNQLIKQR